MHRFFKIFSISRSLNREGVFPLERGVLPVPYNARGDSIRLSLVVSAPAAGAIPGGGGIAGAAGAGG